MSAEFFLTHGAPESTAGSEALATANSGVADNSATAEQPGPHGDGEPGFSSESGVREGLAKEGTASESVTDRGVEKFGERNDEYSEDAGKRISSYDELKGSFYAAASRILGSPAEDIAKMKPSELAEQLSPKLEEFEGIRSAYEIAKPFVEILAQPTNLINPTDFAKTLAEERPGVYGRLAEELVLVHSPEYLGSVLQRYNRYDEKDRGAIDAAMERHMVARVEQMTGLPLTGDQVAEAVGNYVRALKMGQNPGAIYAGQEGNPVGPGANFMPPLTGALAEQIASQLGVDAGDPAVSAVWNMMQQQSIQLARQFGAQIQGLQGKLSMLEQGQRATSHTLGQRREAEAASRLNNELDRARDELMGKLRVPKGYEDELEFIRGAVESQVSKSPALQSLRDQIKGWYLEGNPQRAAGLIGRYTNRVGQIVAEISAPRLQRIEAYEKGRSRELENQSKRRELPTGGIHVNPGGRATSGRMFRNEDEAADAIVGQAMEWLRAKGKES